VVPSTGSVASAADNQARAHTVHGRPALPALLRDACGGPTAGRSGCQQQHDRRHRLAASVAAVGIASAGNVGVETVTLRGHEVPLYLRGVLSGFAGGLAGSSVSFLLHPLDTLKTMKQANTGVCEWVGGCGCGCGWVCLRAHSALASRERVRAVGLASCVHAQCFGYKTCDAAMLTPAPAAAGGNFRGWLEAGGAAIKQKGLYNGLYAGARTAAAVRACRVCVGVFQCACLGGRGVRPAHMTTTTRRHATESHTDGIQLLLACVFGDCAGVFRELCTLFWDV